MDGQFKKVNIRPLASSDVDDLQHNCFPDESLESVADYVQRALRFVKVGKAAHLVAECDGRAVANAQLLCWRERAEIGSLVVAEPLRGRGIGKALIVALGDAAVDLGAEQIEIGAEKDNRLALSLYRRLGFVPYKEVRVPNGGSAQDQVVYLIKPVSPRDRS